MSWAPACRFLHRRRRRPTRRPSPLPRPRLRRRPPSLPAPPPSTQAPSATSASATFKPEEIEALVAPIALYPDSVLSQVLMASTYPLEVVYASRWVKANPNVKGDAAIKAVENQTWDVSVKSLVAFPQVLEPMADKLEWTQKLGDAFLAQQKDVLDAVQRLRAKAQQSGNLKTTEQQKVIIEQAPATTAAAAADDCEDRAGEPAGDLRADLRPGRCVRRLGLSGLSAVLLAALPGLLRLLPRRRLRERHRMGHRFRRGRCHLRQLQLGRRRRQHRHQPGDQHRSQFRPQQGPGRRSLAARCRPSARRGLPRQRDAGEVQQQRGGRRGAQRFSWPRRGGDRAAAIARRRQSSGRGRPAARATAMALRRAAQALVAAVATMPSRAWAAAVQRSATSTVGIRAPGARSPAAGAAPAVGAAAAAGAEKAAMRSTDAPLHRPPGARRCCSHSCRCRLRPQIGCSRRRKRRCRRSATR